MKYFVPKSNQVNIKHAILWSSFVDTFFALFPLFNSKYNACVKMCIICDSLHQPYVHILAIFPFLYTAIVNHPLLLLPLLIFYLRHRCWRHCNCAEGFFLLVLTCMMKRNFFVCRLSSLFVLSNCLQTYRVNYVIERFLLHFFRTHYVTL
jgi:hypothetical protein